MGHEFAGEVGTIFEYEGEATVPDGRWVFTEISVDVVELSEPEVWMTGGSRTESRQS